MALKRSTTIRGDVKFKEMLDKIKIERLKKEKDKKPLSDTRLTLALTRIPNLADFMINSDMRRKKKK